MYIRIATYAPTCSYTPTHFLYNPAHAKHVNRFKILWVYADCWQALGEVVECIALQACSVPENRTSFVSYRGASGIADTCHMKSPKVDHNLPK